MALPNLSAEMARAEITQESIADAIGRTPQSVSRWITGKGSPKVEDAFAIRDRFFPGMTVDYLFDDEPDTR